MKAKPRRPEDTPVKVSPPASHAPVRKPFPGPRGAQAALRVAVDREAHADLIAHARESLHAEVCGVLVGEEGVDDEGSYVHVQAIVRGAQASGGSTHVTFTHEAWEEIHKVMERDHPRRRMVGWYHTHPGFGVEFSEMDLFIQRNFFSGPAQIALVTDPVSGAVAIAVNASGGAVEYLSHYWIDGREQPASVPASVAAAAGTAPSGAAAAEVGALENRLNQMVLAVEDLRASLHRFLLVAGGLVALGILTMVFFLVRQQFMERVKPPELGQFVPIPVKVGEKTVLMGVAVVNWEVPDELNALMVEMEKLRLKEEAEKAKKEGKPAADPSPPPQGAPTPPAAAPQGQPTEAPKAPQAPAQAKPPEAAPPAKAAPDVNTTPKA